MVIDSSALVAILLKEPERDQFVDLIAQAPTRLLSAVNALESALVIEARKGPLGGRQLDLFLYRASIDIVPFDSEHFSEARRIWREFGKGNHPAGLNLCDCAALSLARLSGEPLLFKGLDFHQAGAPSVISRIP